MQKRKKKLGSRELIVLSSCTMALTAMGIDVMLPAFAAIRAHFGLPAASGATAQLVSFFFMGQVTQVVFGLLSDRYGRLAILRSGFPLYIIGGVATAFSPTITLMLLSRFVAGVGASAVFMTTIASIRDRFSGDEMAKVMSFVFSIFLFTPVLAPFLGQAVLRITDWRGVFLTPPVFAVFIFAWSFRLEETLPVSSRSQLDWRGTLQAIKNVLRNAEFRRYTLITTLLFAGLSGYVGNSERLISAVYQKPAIFPAVFAGIGLFMACSSFANARLSAKFGARRTLGYLTAAYGIVALVLLILILIAGTRPPMLPFFVLVALLVGLNLAIEPNSGALALKPMGNMAGLASAVYGMSFFFIGATLGSIISYFPSDGVRPMAISFFVVAVLINILALTGKSSTSNQ